MHINLVLSKVLYTVLHNTNECISDKMEGMKTYDSFDWPICMTGSYCHVVNLSYCSVVECGR